jgi:CNT family concentrative nucleoside transporter
MVCALLSQKFKAIRWKTVLSGVMMQFVLGLFILKTKVGMAIFDGAQEAFSGILKYAGTGAGFVFGPLADIPLLSKVFGPQYGFVFVFQVSAVIILTASLSAVLYHLRILQLFVWGFAKMMHSIMKVSGAESLACAANIFAGQTEAPLLIRPYLSKMTESELMTLMTGGFATIAGGVMAAYVGMGVSAGHLLSASVMSAPAAVVMAKLLVPETGTPVTAGRVAFSKDGISYVNLVDAAAQGAKEGLYLSLNVMGMLIAFIALIAFVNGLLGTLGASLEDILSFVFWPVSWLMGVPVAECGTVAVLLGKRMVLNEFVAYLDFVNVKHTLSERSQVIAIYALCGFANFSSIAIQIGGIGTLVPEKRTELAKLGLRAMIGGTLACFMTACVASILM